METIEQPIFCEEKHLLFLDNLRASGVTNMFGATPYIQENFGLEKTKASKILIYWMNTFSDRS